MASAAKHHLGSVDYIKAIAIVAVVLTHAGLRVGNPALTPFEKIIRQSWVGFQVPAFFLIAGFLYYRARAVFWQWRVGLTLAPPLVVATSTSMTSVPTS